MNTNIKELNMKLKEQLERDRREINEIIKQRKEAEKRLQQLIDELNEQINKIKKESRLI